MVTMGRSRKSRRPASVGGVDGGGHGLRLLDDFGRELVGQVMLADDDFDVDSEIAGVAEDFDDAADGGGAALGEFEQFDVDDHAVEFGDVGDLGGVTPMRSTGAALAGGSSMPSGISIHWLDAGVGGDDVAAAASDLEFADHGGVGAFQHLDDFAIGAASGFDAGDADDDAVAMHGLFGGVGRDEDVSGDPRNGAFGDQEAVAIAVEVEASDGEFAAAGGDHELAALELDQVAARGEAGEGGFQLLAALSFGAQFADELLEVGAGMRQLGDMGYNCRIGHSSNFTCNG